MPITPEQAFKIGFLMYCAEQGFSKEETHARIKEAAEQIKNNQGPTCMTKEAILGGVISGLGALGSGAMSLGGKALSAIPGLFSTGAIVGIGAPILAGVGTGYLAAKMTGGGDKDLVEEAKQDEISGEYDRLAEEARRRARIKRLQLQTGRRIVPLTPSLSG